MRRKTLAAKAPDSRGQFEGSIVSNPAEGDVDGERIADWTNLPTTVPLGYSHALGNDPEAVIGTAQVLELDDGTLKVLGTLTLNKGNAIAEMVYERLLLPSTDRRALTDLSVGFDFTSKTTDPNGVVALHGCTLREVSVCYKGAQSTAITSVKANTNLDLVGFAKTHGITNEKHLHALHYVATALGHNPAALKETLEGMVDEWHDKSTPNRGFISAGPVPVPLNLLDEAELRQHLQSGHDVDAPAVGATARNQMSRQHQVLHGQGDVGHSHSAADRLVQQMRQEQLGGKSADEIDALNAELDRLEDPAVKVHATDEEVDRFIAEDRALREKERAEARAQREWQDQMSRRVEHLVAVPLAQERADDARTHEAFIEESNRREAEAAADRERLNEADAARREDARNDVRTYAP